MKKLLPVCIAVMVMGFIFPSCKTGYIPSPVNIPLFEEKGQFMGNVSIGYHLTAQAAYSVSDQFLIQGDLNSAPDSNLFGSQSFFNHSFGFGYYTKIDERIASESIIGTGFGKTDDIDYFKVYLQQSFGSINDHFEFAFTPRLTIANYQNQDLPNNITDATDVYLEPTFLFRAGALPIKAQMQLGLSVPIVNESDLFSIPFYFSFGLTYKIPSSARITPPDPLQRNAN